MKNKEKKILQRRRSIVQHVYILIGPHEKTVNGSVLFSLNRHTRPMAISPIPTVHFHTLTFGEESIRSHTLYIHTLYIQLYV